MAEAKIEQASERPVIPGPREARPAPARVRRPPAARVALAHGGYLLAAGLWPLVDLRSFKSVTGPKLEAWLTKGVGACLANIGAALGASGARGKVARELRILGMSTALSFAAMDLWYAGARRRISRVYLLNGLAQLGFAAAWGAAEWLESRDARRVPEAAFA
ncbi:MAG TPA: hypothetical protein VE755_10980 [Myxococcales bacterium]|jgi:hypothetical protein|nr:hypothetical protein [Myxococcales bacterium]